MDHTLSGKKVAILATDGVEEVELTEPRTALEKSGAQTQLISIHSGEIKGWDHDHFDKMFPVDQTVGQVSSSDFDALFLPGGVLNPDKLRMDPKAVEFVKEFFNEHKPVASICHGPWMVEEAGAVKGRKVTSWPSLKTDLKNAGANWVDEQVVVDEGLVTSRKPDDIPAFNEKMIEEFAEGPHEGQRFVA